MVIVVVVVEIGGDSLSSIYDFDVEVIKFIGSPEY